MFASVNGAGTLRTKKHGERAVALERATDARDPLTAKLLHAPAPIQRPIAKPADALARHPAMAYSGPSTGPNTIPVAAINSTTGTRRPRTTNTSTTSGSAYQA